jgi:hypothetical protein
MQHISIFEAILRIIIVFIFFIMWKWYKGG